MKKVIVVIEFTNAQEWSDWDEKKDKQVLKGLEDDIRNSLLDTCVVDEIGKIKSEIQEE